MQPISKAQKIYFLTIMSKLDAARMFKGGGFELIGTTRHLMVWGCPDVSDGSRAQGIFLELSNEQDIDRFDLLSPEYIRAVSGQKSGVGGKIYEPTEVGYQMYYKLVGEAILEGVRRFWQTHTDDTPGVVTACPDHIDVGSGTSLSVPLATFNRCVDELKVRGQVIEVERSAPKGCRRLYLTGDTVPTEAQANTMRDQYNTGRDAFSNNNNVTVNYYGDKQEGSNNS